MGAVRITTGFAIHTTLRLCECIYCFENKMMFFASDLSSFLSSQM